MQTREQMLAVLESWLTSKPNLAVNEYNMGKLVAYFNGKEYSALTPELLDQAESEISDLMYIGKPPVLASKKLPKLFQQSSSAGLTHSAREKAQREAEQQAVTQKKALGVDAPGFKAKNEALKRKFEDLIQNGCLTTTFTGKVDTARTAHKREALSKIKVVAKQRDAEGNEVLLYENMVLQAEDLIGRWEHAKEYSK